MNNTYGDLFSTTEDEEKKIMIIDNLNQVWKIL